MTGEVKIKERMATGLMQARRHDTTVYSQGAFPVWPPKYIFQNLPDNDALESEIQNWIFICLAGMNTKCYSKGT